MGIRDGAFMPQTFVSIKSKQIVDMLMCDEKGKRFAFRWLASSTIKQ